MKGPVTCNSCPHVFLELGDDLFLSIVYEILIIVFLYKSHIELASLAFKVIIKFSTGEKKKSEVIYNYPTKKFVSMRFPPAFQKFTNISSLVCRCDSNSFCSLMYWWWSILLVSMKC